MLVPIPGSNGSYEYDPSIPEGSGGGGGGGGGTLICKAEIISMEPMKLILDKTFREIYTAAETMPVFIILSVDMGGESSILTLFVNNVVSVPGESFYGVNVDSQEINQFHASSIDDYPVFEQ